MLLQYSGAVDAGDRRQLPDPTIRVAAGRDSGDSVSIIDASSDLNGLYVDGKDDQGVTDVSVSGSDVENAGVRGG